GNVVSPCAVGGGSFQAAALDGEDGQNQRNWISADGKLLFFPSCGQLYMREFDAEQTKLVSGPSFSGPRCAAVLIKSTADAAFFWTQTRLTADDSNPASCAPSNTSFAEFDGDVYRYDIASGALQCVTCVVTGINSDVYPGLLGGPTAVPSSIAVAEDGSRVYFRSANALTAGAPTPGNGTRNAYRVDVASGDLRYIATGGGVGDMAIAGTSITPDGSAIVFRAKDPSLNPVGEGTDNGGKFQYYRYDDRDRSLVCVSCPPDGPAAVEDVPPKMLGEFTQVGANTTPLADDGDFVFKTTESLVGADQNTAGVGQSSLSGTDIYEWRDGKLLLITDGLTNWPPSEPPILNGVSPSGRDAFFTAPVQYTHDALDAYNRLYDARIGGGFEFPPPPKPCPLEVCQGTPKGAPEEQPSGTSNFAGPGNGESTQAKKKSKKKAHRKKAHKKAHQKKRHNRANATRRTDR
ncbi:MAG TPA: hypothetical protein VMR96_08365, partial [Solirubrobacterales bacterium]|nr:hypothetical protein [Solirubrobacterales bacterium]